MGEVEINFIISFIAGELFADCVGAVPGAGDLLPERVVVVAGGDLPGRVGVDARAAEVVVSKISDFGVLRRGDDG